VIGFSKQQQAAILRLYRGQRLGARETANRLGLNRYRVAHFLRVRGELRQLGNLGVPRKLSTTSWQQLMTELPTTINTVLARKYGISPYRVRQIRQQYGYPASSTLPRPPLLHIRSKTSERQKQAILAALSKQFGLSLEAMEEHIRRLGNEYQGLVRR